MGSISAHRSRVSELTAGCRGDQGIHVDVGASKSMQFLHGPRIHRYYDSGDEIYSVHSVMDACDDFAVVVSQAVLHDVEQFQSRVKSILTADQLDADSIQELLDSDMFTKIDLPERSELQRVTTALSLFTVGYTGH